MADGGVAWLLVCDLDGTLLGIDDETRAEQQAFKAFFQDLRCTALGKGTRPPFLAYATGRCYDDYMALEEAGEVDPPDAVVTSTGAAMRVATDDAVGKDWTRDIIEKTGWDPKRLEEVVAKRGFPCVERAETRLCFLLNEASKDLGDPIRADLEAAGVPATLVLSTQPDGIYLDCMPKAVDKGHAVRFLASRLGVAFERTVVCGDSGNDLAMLQHGGAKGVVVGNAHPELLVRLEAARAAGAVEGEVYMARARCAAGIREGGRHWGLFPSEESAGAGKGAETGLPAAGAVAE